MTIEEEIIKVIEFRELDIMEAGRGAGGSEATSIVQNIIRLSLCSDLRRNIIILLSEGKKSLREIREALNTSATTALHALRELEKAKIIFRDEERDYVLTKTGEILAWKISDIVDAIEALKKHESFWKQHDLSGIPTHLLEKIGCLKNSEVHRINALDIIKTHKTFLQFLKNAKWVKGVSPIFAPDYPIIFRELATTVPTQLVLTREVLEKLLESVNKEDLKRAISECCLEIFVTEEDVKVAFTVTDSFLSLGLFSTEGVYDTTSDLISTDSRAVRWGSELFKHYQKKAEKFLME